MNKTMYNSYLFVDIDQICRNVQAILGTLDGNTRLIPVLKNDAYGLGLLPVAEAVTRFDRVRTVAVAHVSEGVQLREAGVDREILLLSGVPERLLDTAAAYDLTLSVGRPGLLRAAAEAALRAGKPVKLQLKIETGLHRAGIEPGAPLEEAALVLKQAAGKLTLTGAYSHFTDPEDPVQARAQYARFLEGVAQLEKAGISVPLRHISCSAALECCPEFNLDAVRVGRRLFMDHPTRPTGAVGECASWRTDITGLFSAPAGTRLGYGGGVVLQRDTELAIIGVGYGDGLDPALAACRAPVLVNGQRAPLLCCFMDQAMVDITGIPCRVDDEVTLFGYDSRGVLLSSQETALRIGDYEGCGLTSALSARVPRVYSGEGGRTV